MGTKLQIPCNRIAGGGNDRHHPLFAAFAGDPYRIPQRQVAPPQAKSLGNAQTAAVEQDYNRLVARRDPRLITLIFNGFYNFLRRFNR